MVRNEIYKCTSHRSCGELGTARLPCHGYLLSAHRCKEEDHRPVVWSVQGSSCGPCWGEEDGGHDEEDDLAELVEEQPAAAADALRQVSLS